ncbi:T-cell surface glycoprotein CD3 zeta chain-like isoform X2 [Scomber scombrus]|uniref:T-cell surface glycoprotein CD3 zeta chain-like isoform X2 n=1 Tax=Scomber scombrus TaxID=13677 RepID=UPI002DDAC783|nr:T-cell surface glycoprotein CD3 zeta chain-like isoform X2 [Scomber scombrus]
MALQTWISGLLVLAAVVPSAALNMYDPQLCYILDGFLGLYGLIITGMFIKEKFFRTKSKVAEDSIYSDLQGQDNAPYAPLMPNRDPERGRNRKAADDNATYTDLNQKRTESSYKELPARKERQRKNEQVYQGLSSATRDTYDSLQMQQLPARN